MNTRSIENKVIHILKWEFSSSVKGLWALDEGGTVATDLPTIDRLRRHSASSSLHCFVVKWGSPSAKSAGNPLTASVACICVSGRVYLLLLRVSLYLYLRRWFSIVARPMTTANRSMLLSPGRQSWIVWMLFDSSICGRSRKSKE